MITTQQLEAFWERYQHEGVADDTSMRFFCSMLNVPYNFFQTPRQEALKIQEHPADGHQRHAGRH